jgi:hypothetical protein
MNDLEQAQAGIARMTDPDPNSVNIECYEDTFTGLWEHECPECLVTTEPGVTCSFQ